MDKVRCRKSYYPYMIQSPNTVIVFSPNTVGDSTATVAKMAEKVLLVRINIVYEVIMCSAVILLAVSLFEILKDFDRLLARTAMLLRTGEAILEFLPVLCMLAVLILSIFN